MINQVTFLFNAYPWLQHVVAVLVVCRIVFKPLFSIITKYVELTVEDNDDKKLNAFMKTKKYKMLVFIVDLTTSIRLPKVREEKK